MNPIQITARLAGLFYLLQIPLGVFGILYVSKVLLVPGDVAATAANILAHEFLYRLSMVSTIICALITIVTALYLYRVLKPVNKSYAATMVICTLVVAPISMLNELNHVAILLLLKTPEYLTVFTEKQVQILLSVFFGLHEYGIHIVDMFFGLWLFPMGYLVLKSNYFPKIIGLLLIAASFGYLADFVSFFAFPGFSVVFSEYTFIGEAMMVLWLLVKGVNVERWEKHVRDSILTRA